MNEDERGITPPNATAMTVECRDTGWHVTIEQGNGDVIKTIELTGQEGLQLAAILDGYGASALGLTPDQWARLTLGQRTVHVSFVDVTRPERTLDIDAGVLSHADREMIARATGGGIRSRELQVEFED